MWRDGEYTTGTYNMVAYFLRDMSAEFIINVISIKKTELGNWTVVYRIINKEDFEEKGMI